MNDALLIVLIVIGFAVVFPLFWMAIVGMIGFLGGWRTLAKEFPYPGDVPENTVHVRTLSISLLGRYNNVCRMAVEHDGVVFATMIMFRFGHPPFRIPRAALKHGGSAILGGRVFLLTRPNGRTRKITIYGDAGRLLEQWLAS